MKNYKHYLLLLLLPLGIMVSNTSCKKSKDPYLGAEVVAATANFSVGSICAVKYDPLVTDNTCPPTVTGAQFGLGSGAAEKYYFHCDFNERVTWTITITGRTSGAIKTMSGTSNSLPFNNQLTIWNGNASGNRFFQKGETCDIVITFLGSTKTAATTLTMKASPIGALRYENFPNIAVIDNFDGTFTGTSMSIPYVDQGDGDKNNIYQARSNGVITPIDGVFMLRFMGEDLNQNTYLGGTGPELLTSHAGAIYKIVPKCATDASQLYVNLYVYGTGLLSSNLQIRSYELDTLDICQNRATNPFPIAYTIDAQANNDQWSSDIYINWTGWKLVSIPYSSFKPANNPASGGNGNRIKEPRRVTGFNILLQSMPTAGSKVDTYIDYMTLSWGVPFQQ